jgi:hypothetical protein
MRWRDSHLHQFTLKNPSTDVMDLIGIPGEELEDEPEVHPGWKKKVADHFPVAGISARYLYDFGDHWEHSIELEEIRARKQGARYPLCVDGRRACPPEDCGGVYGFHDFLKTIVVLGQESRQETLEWAGEEYDPWRFDPKEVHYDDPQKRWKTAFQGD